jgi:hypothetical protein
MKNADAIAPLVAAYKKDVQLALAEGFRLKWEAVAKLDAYVRRLSDVVGKFQDKVDDLLVKHERIAAAIEELKTCALSVASFSKALATVQSLVDELNLAAYVLFSSPSIFLHYFLLKHHYPWISPAFGNTGTRISARGSRIWTRRSRASYSRVSARPSRCGR